MLLRYDEFFYFNNVLEFYYIVFSLFEFNYIFRVELNVILMFKYIYFWNNYSF